MMLGVTSPSKNPFAALQNLRDQLPAGKVEEVRSPEQTVRGPARAVVRLEKKQRRGKEVTVIDKLGLKAPELEAWCRDLKHALGCGGTVDGDVIVLQGDLRTRLPGLLTDKGVLKVTVSG